MILLIMYGILNKVWHDNCSVIFYNNMKFKRKNLFRDLKHQIPRDCREQLHIFKLTVCWNWEMKKCTSLCLARNLHLYRVQKYTVFPLVMYYYVCIHYYVCTSKCYLWFPYNIGTQISNVFEIQKSLAGTWTFCFLKTLLLSA